MHNSCEQTPVNHSKFPDIEPLATQPRVVEGRLHVFPKDRLSNNAASFILGTCAFFPWTVYIAPEDEVKMYPSCLSMNHCGGRPPLREMGGQLLFSTSLVCPPLLTRLCSYHEWVTDNFLRLLFSSR